MPIVKRYAPLVGAAILVAGVILRLFGLEDLATSIEGLSVGLTAQSPVGALELAAAAATLVGIVLKIKAVVKPVEPKP